MTAATLYYHRMLYLCRIALLAGLLIASDNACCEERLPADLIRIPESVTTVFIAETATAYFHRYDRVGDDVEYGGKRYMSIGQNGVGKERSGDRRTPLGVYFVTEELDTTRLHEKYGARAYPLDYPNAWDLSLARTGDGIWVHGVDPRGGKRPPQDTDGCIALPNEDLAELADQLEGNTTPILIAREIIWSDPATRLRLRDELETAVERWAASVESGDMHAYLSLYADDFERWEMRKAQWSSFSLQTLGRRAIEEVDVTDLLLLGYPDVEGLYLSRFRQTIREGATQSESIKRLYWRRDTSGALEIIAEDSG